MNKGQYFSKNIELQKTIFSLCKNKGKYLEPSSGAGHIVKFFEEKSINSTAIEIDDSIKIVSKNKPLIKNFFDYSINNKFNTVYGNPPYVKWQKIEDREKITSIFGGCNLYLYFIEKCFYHLEENGEMIFIIPRDFFTSTRGIGIRKLLYENGTITDIVDYEERIMFDNATPYVVIFRYEKGNFIHKTNYIIKKIKETKNEILLNDNIIFSNNIGKEKLENYFDVKVGIVSGANDVFEIDTNLSIDVICSDFIRTKRKRKFLFLENFYIDEVDKEIYKYLIKNKNILLNRKIKAFNETNWWKWGAVRNLSYMEQDGYYIYVNCKTREEKPFFKEKASYFDGSILALIPKDKKIDLNFWIKKLNSSINSFREHNMFINNKYILSQRTLCNFMI